MVTQQESKSERQPQIYEITSNLSQVNERTSKFIMAIQEKLNQLHQWMPEPEPSKGGEMLINSDSGALSSLALNVKQADDNSRYLGILLKHLEQIV